MASLLLARLHIVQGARLVTVVGVEVKIVSNNGNVLRALDIYPRRAIGNLHKTL